MQMTATYQVAIGRKRYTVPSLQVASEVFCAARDKAMTGASRTPTPLVYDAAGKQIGYISYNGRVWPGRTYRPDATPLYDNR